MFVFTLGNILPVMFHLVLAYLTNILSQVQPHDWEAIIQIATILVSLLGGGGAVWIVDLLKQWLGWSGSKAIILTAIVSTILAGAVLIVEGKITGAGVNWANLGWLFSIVFAAAKVQFDRIRKEQEETKLKEATSG